MEESNLSMLQRKSIQNAVNRGESLPHLNTKSKQDKKERDEPHVFYPGLWKKRSQNMIVNSGAYERERFRRTAPLPDRDRQKRHLASMMTYGRNMPSTPCGPKILHATKKEPLIPEDEEIFQELIEGIRERIQFLNDMKALGHGKKYQQIIQQEVAEKVRLVELMNKNRSSVLAKELEKFKTKKPPPKPFPLGDIS